MRKYLEVRQLNFPTSAGSTDLGQTEDRVIQADQFAYITGQPAKPQLRARILNATSADNVQWRLEIRTERTERGTRDNRNYPQSGFITKPGNEIWNIEALFGAEIVGGRATIRYKINGGAEQVFEFFIRGKNPTDAAAIGAIQAEFTDYPFQTAWAMAQHETRMGQRVHNQFNPAGTLVERPFFGDPDGWGFFQIDRSGETGGFTSTQEVYDWRACITAARAKLNEKRDNMDRFFRWIRNRWGNDTRWEEPPSDWTISNTTLTPLELGTMVLYNGSQGVPIYQGRDDNGVLQNIASPWQFDPTRAAGNRWLFFDNVNDYVDAVITNEWEGGLGTTE